MTLTADPTTTRELLIVVDGDLRVAAYSNELANVVDQPETRLGTHVLGLVHRDDQVDARAALEGALESGAAASAALRLRWVEGGHQRFEATIRPLVNAEARPTLLLVLRNLDAWVSSVDLAALSDRESEILKMVADGYRVTTIARQLEISPSTVRNHLSSIFRKSGVSNQAQLLELLRDGTSSK